MKKNTNTLFTLVEKDTIIVKRHKILTYELTGEKENCFFCDEPCIVFYQAS